MLGGDVVEGISDPGVSEVVYIYAWRLLDNLILIWFRFVTEQHPQGLLVHLKKLPWEEYYH